MRKSPHNGIGKSSDILASPTDLNEPVDPNDPFPYGWRYVANVLPDGSESIKQVPLTLEDILHPQEEDCQMLSDPHTEDCYYLRGAFRIALKEIPGATILSDCRIAWDRRGKFGHGPDCAVIFNVRAKQRWSTFNVVKEKTKPVLIVEVTSPKTRSTDLVSKVREYAAQGVPHYVIADARENEDSRRISLLDYHLSPGCSDYFALPLSDDGRVRLPELNLWLGAEDGRLVCYDAHGNRQKTHEEIHRALRMAEKKAAKEQRAREEMSRERDEVSRERDELAARLKEMEARLKRQHGGTNGSASAK